jgi:hypothetical protein
MDAAFSAKDQAATAPKRSSYFCGSTNAGSKEGADANWRWLRAAWAYSMNPTGTMLELEFSAGFHEREGRELFSSGLLALRVATLPMNAISNGDNPPSLDVTVRKPSRNLSPIGLVFNRNTAEAKVETYSAGTACAIGTLARRGRID